MRQLLAIPILACGLVLAAACSRCPGPAIPHASGSASASASAGSGDLTAFVNCVRQHGVTVPDHVTLQAAWQQAEQQHSPDWEECNALLPPRPANQPPSAQQLEQLRNYSVCMRAHGIDMADPTPTGDTTIGGRLAHASKAQVANDPGFKAAQAACKNKLPANWNSPRKNR